MMSNPRKTPSQQRSRFTYLTILEAAARVFDREGMSATTNRIAEEAGFSVGSLYQYFPNKQAILHELTLRHIDRAEDAFAGALQHVHVTRPDLGTLIAELVNLAVEQNGPLARAHQLMREHARTPEIERRFHRFIDMIVDGLVAYLDRSGDDSGDIRVSIRLAVAALDSQIHNIVLDAATPDEREARTALAVDQTVRMLHNIEPA